MTDINYEDVVVPRGAYISWGSKTGQHVTGVVLGFDPTGGTDFNDRPCPQLTLELSEPAASINKEGVRTDFAAGELVLLNAGPVSLKRAVMAAQPAVGDIVKIILANLVEVAKGTVKEFDIKIARGAGKAVATATAQNAASQEVPF